MTLARGTHLAAATTLCMLAALCVAWELWLAPLRPGGSWLALKVLPLLWIAPGILRGGLYTYRASTMLILAYFAEGTVRAYSDSGLSGMLALAETVLATIFFIAVIAHVRARRAASNSAIAAI
jgi:uncharacterized membrane protein